MKINKGTWHYRTWDCWVTRSIGKKARQQRNYRANREMPTLSRRNAAPPNLCLYVRVVLFWGWFSRLGRFADSNMWFAPGVVLVAWHAAGWFLASDTLGWIRWILPTVALLGIALVLFIILGAIHLWEQLPARPLEKGESSFVIEYVKAKKRKICPLIEFMD